MSLIVFTDGRPTPLRTTSTADSEVEPVEPVSPIARRSYDRSGESPRPKQHRPALRVADIMTSPVVTVPSDTPLGEIRELMSSRRFRHLPVTGPSNDTPHSALLGMISDRDLLRTQLDPPDRLASEVMTTTVLTAVPSTPLNEAASVMLERRVHSLPVLAGHQPIGIMTTTDVLRALVRRAPLDLWA